MEPEKLPEQHCKYKEETERCVLNPDSSASEDDPKCYKTDKNRCATKKKKIIKIKPKKGKLEMVVEKEQQVEQVEKEQGEKPKPKKQNDFLYPDLNDKNFNLKIS